MQILLRLRFLVVLACMMSSTLFVSAPASASTIYQGRDYSTTINGTDSGDIRVCDREIDNHIAYTRFQRFSDLKFVILRDNQGGGTACADYYGFDYIVKHQTCETRGGGVGGGDDVCSTYSRHV